MPFLNQRKATMTFLCSTRWQTPALLHWIACCSKVVDSIMISFLDSGQGEGDVHDFAFCQSLTPRTHFRCGAKCSCVPAKPRESLVVPYFLYVRPPVAHRCFLFFCQHDCCLRRSNCRSITYFCRTYSTCRRVASFLIDDP